MNEAKDVSKKTPLIILLVDLAVGIGLAIVFALALKAIFLGGDE